MGRAFVLIDNGYLTPILRKLTTSKDEIRFKLDYKKFSETIVNSNQDELVRSIVYDCPPYLNKKNSKKEDTDRHQRAMNFFNKLKSMDKIDVKLGYLGFRGMNSDGKPIYVQKKVDVLLTLDLVKYGPRADRIYLVTGDQDFIPAIEYAQENGINVCIVRIQDAWISDQIMRVCDQSMELTWSQLSTLKR